MSNRLRVLVGCERYGHVRDAFLALGHDAYSCDLREAVERDKQRYDRHIVDDVVAVARGRWDLAIFHPPCTFLASSGLFWNLQREGRAQQTEEALELVRVLLGMEHIPKIALENPIGCISTRIREADQIIQPWMFGSDASKATCLWLKNLPRLVPLYPTIRDVPASLGRMVEIDDPTAFLPRKVRRFENQVDSGANKLTPGPERSDLRSMTYPPIAEEMARRWGLAARRMPTL